MLPLGSIWALIARAEVLWQTNRLEAEISGLNQSSHLRDISGAYFE